MGSRNRGQVQGEMHKEPVSQRPECKEEFEFYDTFSANTIMHLD